MQQNFMAPQKLNHIDTNVSFQRDASGFNPCSWPTGQPSRMRSIEKTHLAFSRG